MIIALSLVGGLVFIALAAHEFYVAMRSCQDENANPERDGLDIEA